MASSRYIIEYQGAFTFPLPPQQTWATIAELGSIGDWCKWLHDFQVDGTGLERGTRLHGVVVPPLPYRMRLQVLFNQCVPPRLITASVHGDLEGRAQLVLEGYQGQTRAVASWTIEMMSRPMRLAARVAPPLLRWGHDRVVEATVAGFRRHLSDARSGEPGDSERDVESDHPPR